MFDSILIANRGEIACRIIRTARRLGIRTIAVYSDVDADSLHVALADEAWRIGRPPARDSYLCIERLIDVARTSGAEAIHPGYGFLSENADFAEACAGAGIVFIGPPADAIRAMGSKSAAKRIMERAGVPLVPGYHGEDQNPAVLKQAADEIGYPILIKASAGGGGRGMRVVAEAGEFDKSLESAKRESVSAFGDDTVLIEKYLTRPRHIEMQVFADRQGNAIHLFERDCSIQRRHQKIVEEAPAPGMTDAMRAAMGEAAVAAARAIGYTGAGTVEFIVDAERVGETDGFYFMEMNTRLQVEHPVTEMITGIDLVEWQIAVAAGGALPLRQDEIAISGYAVEARLYAENPIRDFLPSTGTLRHFRLPRESSYVRVDSGVRQGDAVSMHYDPMIAKLVVWGDDRRTALRRLRAALTEVEVVGLTTNRDFLAAVAAHPAFAAAELDTGFIDRYRNDLIRTVAPISHEVRALAALDELLLRKKEALDRALASGDPHSPWHCVDGWRLNGQGRIDLHFRDTDGETVIGARATGGGWQLELADGAIHVSGALQPDGTLGADLGGRHVTARVVRHGAERHVFIDGCSYMSILYDPLVAASTQEVGSGKLTAPMPGRIIAVHVAVGERVRSGQALVTIEAMKMEHTIVAPVDGEVAAVQFRLGDQVDEGAEVIAIEARRGE